MKEVNYPEKLFKPQILLLILVSIFFLLVALFPWNTANYLNSQKASILKEQFSSRLKTEYYQLLNKKSSSIEEVLALAQSLTKGGLWGNSINLLEKKVGNYQLTDDQLTRYKLISLNNNIGLYYKSVNEPNKDRLKHLVRLQLSDIAKSKKLSNTSLPFLAKYSLAFDLNPLATSYYEILAQNDLLHKSKYYNKAGKLAILSGDFDKATTMFNFALKTSSSVGQLNQNMYLWLQALNSAKKYKKIDKFLRLVEKNPSKYQNSLGSIAKASAEYGNTTTAVSLFRYLAFNSKSDNQKQRWFEKASYWAASGGKYDEAVTLLLKAQKKASNINELWFIKQRLVELNLRAGNDKVALSSVIASLKKEPNDVRIINQAIEISLAMKKTKIAREINHAYLQLKPDSSDALIHQAKIEAADKKYQKAVKYIKKAIKIIPNNIAPYQLWATYEEQQGNYTSALNIWIWIYKQANNKQNRLRLISIAQNDLSGKGLNILEQLAQTSELPRQAIYDVFYHFVNNQKKKQALSFLQEYLISHKAEKELYITLAKSQSAQKHYKSSLETWGNIERHFGKTKLSSLHQFELLWVLHKKKEAFSLWRKNKAYWKKNIDTKYVSIMAELCWQYNYKNSAARYYKILLGRNYKRSLSEFVLQYTRVSEVQEESGREDKALSTLRKGFFRTSSSKLLLRGLQLSFDYYDDDNFEDFVLLANTQNTDIRKKSRYWILLGAYDQRHYKFETALQYYKHALSINPQSRDAFIGINALKKVGVS